MNLLYSRNHLQETGTPLPQTAKAAQEEGWKQVSASGTPSITYFLMEKADVWLLMLEVGKRSCPILVRDWISLVNCMSILNAMVSGQLREDFVERLDEKALTRQDSVSEQPSTKRGSKVT